MAARCVAVLLVVLVSCSVAAAQTPRETSPLVAPDGRAVRWQQWLDENGPAAVLVWASWAPRAGAVMERLEDLAGACRARGLSPVVVDVQEPMEDARAALDGRGVTWLHDRHGAVLKRHRVIRVPALIVVDRKGVVLGRLEATPEAVRRWRDPGEER
jgi:hypothetical protein